jgi:hypothetical protein
VKYVGPSTSNALLDEQAYHSEVSATKKELIHRSWMRNETQVVVATIAFGLGCVFTGGFGSCGVRDTSSSSLTPVRRFQH